MVRTRAQDDRPRTRPSAPVDTGSSEAVGGHSSTAREVGRADGVVLFQTALVRSAVRKDIDQDRFTYTARDAVGNVIDQVTLRGLD